MDDQLPVSETPGYGQARREQSVCSLLLDRAADDPDGVFAERRTVDGTFVPITVTQLRRDVLSAARGLVGRGVQVGDRVGIMAATRYEWTVLDLAVLMCGAVVVPIYDTSSAEQVRWIVGDADVHVIVAGTDEQSARCRPLVDVTTLREVLVLDPADGGRPALEQLAADGAEITETEVLARAAACDLETLATVIYTSGTTGRPKGVEITHGNVVVHVQNGVDDPNLGQVVKGGHTRTLMFLPLAHTFGRFINILCLYSRTVVGYVSDTRTLVDDLQAFRPTWLLAVPRVFEKFYNSADAQAGTGLRRRLFRWAAATARRWSEDLEQHGGQGRPSLLLRLQLAVADRLVLRRIRAVMGGQVQYAISGGAPLATRLGHFFRGVGITVMEGYGLTELSAPTAVNRPGLIKIGSVGAPYPGTRARIAADGEVQVQGPNVFRGYLNDPEATAAAFTDDGWFRTGDLGRLDADGYLSITGRSKEIIVTAGGKNVQPAALEDALRSHPLISEVVVVGDQRPFIGALVALDTEMLPRWLANHGLPEHLDAEQAGREPRVREALDQAVAAANEQVSRAESIRKYVVLPRELTEADGELSASAKVRRPVVLEHFARQFDELYAGR
ncbi:AMP-dependent synthetase/ligase [Nakamurella leprariae]|uniref:Long-chain fatty acid--CoA ligase n=1 Tax=Nakamurella leprariae TaxID=2803911 RepID=A0A939BZM5_9ACTN|nr:long-chain fatty acid--CoA ligase [Nakamurella leprariae]MBM9467861.1 long-chain fatty acid--CoA ligase [Nakamurella leprariae]